MTNDAEENLALMTQVLQAATTFQPPIRSNLSILREHDLQASASLRLYINMLSSTRYDYNRDLLFE